MCVAQQMDRVFAVVVRALQSPEEDYFSAHVRIVGDWTGTFAFTMNV